FPCLSRLFFLEVARRASIRAFVQVDFHRWPRLGASLAMLRHEHADAAHDDAVHVLVLVAALDNQLAAILKKSSVIESAPSAFQERRRPEHRIDQTGCRADFRT